MEITCVIFENSKKDAEPLLGLIKNNPILKLIKVCYPPHDSVEDFYVDMVFINIENVLIKYSDYYKVLKLNSRFVVLTGKAENAAVKAFDMEADDFLLKPLYQERFDQSVNKCMKFISRIQKETAPFEGFIFLKDTDKGNDLVKVHFLEICVVEAAGNYSKVYTIGGTYIRTKVLLMNIEKQLAPKDKFLRVHRSYIISKLHIEGTDNGALRIRGHKPSIAIGKNYRPGVIHFLTSKSLL